MDLPREPQTVTANKAEAQPNWVHIGFFVLAVATVLGVVWMLSGPLSVSVPGDKDLEIENVEDLRNYFWSLGMVVAGIVAIWGLSFAAVRTVALDRQARVAVQETRLDGAKLGKAHLNGAYLRKAYLYGATLFQAHLEGAVLSGADLGGADLRNISFNSETKVEWADFTKAFNIPAKPDHDFRATVRNADKATWPDDDDSGAWDRGEDDDGEKEA